MNSKNFEPYDLSAYEGLVDIRLFNKIIAFVIHTAGKDENSDIIKDIKEHMWFHTADPLDIQNKHGFRYFGELLERSEEKIGSDICCMRAIALAMAFTRDLLTEEMFIGNQRINFIKKIERLSAADIYLKGALFLLYQREEQGDIFRTELINQEYRDTQELLFVLTLFDDFEMAMEALKPQLLNLMTTSRSISAIHNTRLYAWLIKKVIPVLQANRKKDMALFRSLAKLPVSFVKKGSPIYDVLRENGYNHDEIAYLNYSLLRYPPAVGSSVYLHSITAEKIAIEFAKTFINSAETHSERTYQYLSWLLDVYRTFEIKLQGHKGLMHAIADDIKLTNPKTFGWLFKETDIKTIFHLDIMDEKWDSLPQMLSAKAYRELFEDQLENEQKQPAEYLLKCIAKYDTLTGTSYLDSFDDYTWSRDCAFSVLVKKGIISLKDSFDSCINQVADCDSKQKNYPELLKYISGFVKKVRTREAFEFFQYFFTNHGEFESCAIFGERCHFSDDIFTDTSSYYSSHKKELDIERDFLSDDEHRQFLGWLDDCIFKNKTGQYMDFVVCVLDNDFVARIVPKDELREIYDSICKVDIGIFKNRHRQLKDKYLTADELAAEKDAELARKEDAKRMEALRQQEEMAAEFQKSDDGSFSSLFKFQKQYKSYMFSEKQILALRMVKEKVDDLMSVENCVLPLAEIHTLIYLGNIMLDKGVINYDEFKNYILKTEEAKQNAVNDEQDNPDTFNV